MATVRDRYRLDIDVAGATGALGGLQGALGKLAGVAAAAFTVDKIVDFGKAIIESTRKFETYSNQLRLITNGQAELEELTNKLTVAARNNRAAFGDTVDLFTKLTLATADLGISQERVLKVTGQFQKALAISGADAGTAAGAIRQFGQAMSSGTVRGDEFNSIVEALGPALSIMARESGLTVGKLRELSQTGQLTAEVFFELVEQSTALELSFNKTEQTIGQLEQSMGDSFDRLLVKIGNVSGATETYRQTIIELGRAADFYAGTDGVAVNLNISELVNFKEAGISATDALAELQTRLDSMDTLGFKAVAAIFGGDVAGAAEALALAIAMVTAEIAEFDAATQKLTEQGDALRAQQEALQAILAPHQRFIDQAAKFAKTDYSTALEKASQRMIDAEIVIEQLQLAFTRSNGELQNFAELLRAAQNELSDATLRVGELKNAADDLNVKDSFTKFFDSLVDGARSSVTEQTNAMMAQQALKEALQEGKIGVDVYAAGVDRLNGILGLTDENATNAAASLKSATDSINGYLTGINQSTEDAKFNLEALNMTPLQKQLAEIDRDLNRGLTQQIAKLNDAMSEGADPTAIRQQIELIKTATQSAIQEQGTAATAAYDQQRSFSHGWKTAFEEYQENATNAAESAGRIFDRVTGGMEDSIVNFAKTGKFEFKSFAASVLEDILRIQIRKSIAGLLGGTGGGGGGDGGGLFAGFFANGGTIPAGQFGIAGEAGPELISGPATVTPMTGGTTVIYNINAVDAPSFQQLVARDPKFIHAVAEKGRQNLTGTRR
jgi:tape measure domain-containing protein